MTKDMYLEYIKKSYIYNSIIRQTSQFKKKKKTTDALQKKTFNWTINEKMSNIFSP